MVKKLLTCVMLVLLTASWAWAEPELWSGHYSRAGLADGHSDYSSAKFHHLRLTVDDNSRSATQEYLDLKGTFTLSGGAYSFISELPQLIEAGAS